MTKPLLELSTLEPERQVVAIDGVAYELALPDDFGVVTTARIQRMQAKVNAVMQREGDDLSEADTGTLVSALDTLTALLLPGMPEAVRAKLRDGQKLAIVQAFRQAAESRGKPLPPTIPPSIGVT